MALCLEGLPRAVALIRAGSQWFNGSSNAAAVTAAAFVSEEGIEPGAPLLVCFDQRALPADEAFLCTDDWRCAVSWVKELAVRGAPAIGAAGASAVALAAHEASTGGGERFCERLEEAASVIRAARPTAVNLAWAVDRCMDCAEALTRSGAAPDAVAAALFDEACAIMREDEAANRRIGTFGAELLPQGCNVLTHCNAGSLATSFYGTALGVVYAAADAGKIRMVFADETRPVCQGSRLTAWELARAGVPVTLICDDMAASVMASGKVDAVVVGADRIAANGDVANKIGTLGVAVLAHHFSIPFYVAAPTSTVDRAVPDGNAIPIEERTAAEVLPHPMEGVGVFNPAFDVTPAHLVTAIITEAGVCSPGDILQALEQEV